LLAKERQEHRLPLKITIPWYAGKSIKITSHVFAGQADLQDLPGKARQTRF